MSRQRLDPYCYADWPLPGCAVNEAWDAVKQDLEYAKLRTTGRQAIDTRYQTYGDTLCLDCQEAYARRRQLCQNCCDQRLRDGKPLPPRLRG